MTASLKGVFPRHRTRPVRVGNVTIGGDSPVVVQSMCDTDTRDVEATCEQIARMVDAGCDLVRLAVPDMEAAKAFGQIKKRTIVPLVADIHFNYKLALAALESGADKLRLNPGNIREPERVGQVVKAAKERGVPIRIGVNAGSIDRSRFPDPTPEALVDSALGHIRILEDLDFFEYIVSLKAFDVPTAVAAYRLMAQRRDCPLHIGITEAGLPWQGTIRSATGLGTLLSLGLGDTMRISLVGDPVEEVKVCWEVLKSLNLRHKGFTLIACPSCGRCEIDLQGAAEEVNRRLQTLPQPSREFKVAVMGCVVNGPGEAQEAEIGITGGDGLGLIFRKGKIVRKVKEEEMVDALMEELRGMSVEPGSQTEGAPDLLAMATGPND